MEQTELLSQSTGEQEIPYNHEAVRKAVHIFALIIPALYLVLPRSITMILLIPTAITAILLDLARMTGHPAWSKFGVKLFGCMIRPTEKAGFTGASYILLTNFLAIALFSKPVAVACIAFEVLGDATAALIGRRWGYHKFGRKSIEGSLAFFVTAAIPALLLHLGFGPGFPVLVGISGALTATLVEAMSTSSNDNLTVPIISGFYMQVLMALL